MAKDKSYQELRAELDEIVANLQSDVLDIDDATKQYEAGMQIVQELESYLKKSELKIEKVKAKFKQ